VGGLTVDHTGVSGAMALGGGLALAMAALIAVRAKDDGQPSVKLHAVH
jgi:hypothetical protein